MRQWDFAAAQRADLVVAISEYVGHRVSKYYRRDWSVIYPPVETARLKPASKRSDYYIVVSRLIPYKRVDLAVAAAKQLDVPLIVIGDGSERSRLEAMAGPKTQFLGRLSDAEIAEYYSKAKAFVFTADEDFGITPLEAMAAGAPVVAFGKGGALETVVEGETGTFFREQTPESVVEAMKRLGTMQFDPAKVRKHAEKFSEARFIREMRELVDRELAKRQPDN
jgi:glycosyltransferase involved in cell wall biosynthesis